MNYETRKNVWLILIALLFAVAAAWLATRWIQTRVDAADAGKLSLSNVVVATRDLPLGKRIEPADVKVVRAISSSVPFDSFVSTDEVVGQVSRSTLLSGEVLINRRLAKHSGGSALAAVLAPGMRAVTVRVDDVIGVGGFVLPENRVDVVAAFQEGDVLASRDHFARHSGSRGRSKIRSGDRRGAGGAGRHAGSDTRRRREDSSRWATRTYPTHFAESHRGRDHAQRQRCAHGGGRSGSATNRGRNPFHQDATTREATRSIVRRDADTRYADDHT